MQSPEKLQSDPDCGCHRKLREPGMTDDSRMQGQKNHNRIVLFQDLSSLETARPFVEYF